MGHTPSTSSSAHNHRSGRRAAFHAFLKGAGRGCRVGPQVEAVDNSNDRISHTAHPNGGPLSIQTETNSLPDGLRRPCGTDSSREAAGPCLQASTGRSRWSVRSVVTRRSW